MFIVYGNPNIGTRPVDVEIWCGKDTNANSVATLLKTKQNTDFVDQMLIPFEPIQYKWILLDRAIVLILYFATFFSKNSPNPHDRFQPNFHETSIKFLQT